MNMLYIGSMLLGLILLSYAIFSYEDEERRVQVWFDDALVRTWIYLEDSSRKVSGKLYLILKQLLGYTNRIFDEIFGYCLFSRRTLVTTAALASAVAIVYIPQGSSLPAWQRLVLVFSIILVLFLKNKQTATIAQLILLALLATAYVFQAVASDQAEPFFSKEVEELIGRMPGILFGLILGFTQAFLSIALFRKIFRIAAQQPRLMLAVIYQTAPAILAPLLSIALFFLIRISAWAVGHSGWGSLHQVLQFIVASDLILDLSMLQIFSSIPVVVLSIAASTGALTSAILPRSIYSAIKLRSLSNRKSIVALGIGLVVFGSQPLGMFLKSIISALGA
ncbi:hypothetical protein [Massilia sp. erpn]|uniref:hypothetical protein n=1 Tax=Massilia sp. erpn TaxID=2738142 RepID=UPI002107D54A|nr:hypothetical protein [Massilia sp. erpn]UTY58999.1 hypothetical protein HPQ68_18535 [Massilia sp. erpn]